MKTTKLFRLDCVIAVSVLLSTSSFADNATETVIPGYVAHGINVFNDKPLVDYSEVSPTVPWLDINARVKEIGVFTPGSTDAGAITEYTDRSTPVATIRSFFDFFNPAGNVDPTLFNRTLDKVGTSFFGYKAIDDRVLMQPFGMARAGEIYRAKGTIERPSVGDWEKISGQVRVSCRLDGTAVVSVAIHDAFPNALYTVWDVGVLNPLEPEEQGYAIPLGGVPNILLTDKTGCGVKEIEVAYCPTTVCAPGTGFCSSYLSVFYHWDNQAYGGSPAATFAGMPTGVAAANQMVWPMNGKVLSEPVTAYRKNSADCTAHDEYKPDHIVEAHHADLESRFEGHGRRGTSPHVGGKDMNDD